MIKLLSILALGVALAGTHNLASANKLGDCSKEAAAKGLKGEERNKYLSSCNKGETAPAKPESKLGACSKEAAAKGLKGDERNKYLSECNKK